MTADINRRSDTLLMLISILPVIVFGFVFLFPSDVWIALIFFSPALTFLVTLAIVPRLGGVSVDRKTFSRIVSIGGLVMLLGTLLPQLERRTVSAVGFAYLVCYVLVAVWNLGYVSFRMAKRIP